MATAEPSLPATSVISTGLHRATLAAGRRPFALSMEARDRDDHLLGGETPTRNNPVPNTSSCWDEHWARNYGGSDPEDKTGAPRSTSPPHSRRARTPSTWRCHTTIWSTARSSRKRRRSSRGLRSNTKGPTQSVCHGRWIAIRFWRPRLLRAMGGCRPLPHGPLPIRLRQ